MASSPEFKHPLELYDRVVTGMAWEADAGEISCVVGTDNGEIVREPVTIGDKILHMPTKEFLANPDWERYIAFHPLSENPMRGESEVQRVMTRYMGANFNTTLAVLMEGLIRVAADTDNHRKLSAAASECLDAVPKADSKSVKDMEKILKLLDKESLRDIGKIIDSMGTTSRRKLINVYLKRGGTYKGKEHGRVCVVEFPFLSEEVSDDETRSIFGVKLRVNDYKGFRKLFGFIVNTMEPNSEMYNSGTNTMTAPYFTAMLETWFKVAERLNKVIRTYQKYVPELADLKYDTSWKAALEDFTELARLIPPLDGNVGVHEAGNNVNKSAVAKKPGRNLNSKLVQKEPAPRTAIETEMATPVEQVVEPQATAQPSLALQPTHQPMPPVAHQPAAPAVRTAAPGATVSMRDLLARDQAQRPQMQQPHYQQVMPYNNVMRVSSGDLIRNQHQYMQQQPQQSWASAALSDPQPVQQQQPAYSTTRNQVFPQNNAGMQMVGNGMGGHQRLLV